MMEFKTFVSYIEDNILSGWMEDADIKIQNVRKNNNALYVGLYIHRNGAAVTPILYLNQYYKLYQDGQPVPKIIRQIRREYEWAMAQASDYQLDLLDYENVKDRVIYRLVNYQKNQEMLSMCPHIRLYDLALTFRWLAHQDDAGISTSLITNQELGIWGVTIHDLLLAAQENTRKLFPGKIMDMDCFLKEYGESFSAPGHIPMYIVTNEQQINGATAMVYEGLLKDFAIKRPSDYYILPSSIHEIILVPADGTAETDDLFDIVEEVNRMLVAEDEILSDSIYLYEYESGKIVPLKSNRK